jgi:hypothetical protein
MPFEGDPPLLGSNSEQNRLACGAALDWRSQSTEVIIYTTLHSYHPSNQELSVFVQRMLALSKRFVQVYNVRIGTHTTVPIHLCIAQLFCTVGALGLALYKSAALNMVIIPPPQSASELRYCVPVAMRVLLYSS